MDYLEEMKRINSSQCSSRTGKYNKEDRPMQEENRTRNQLSAKIQTQFSLSLNKRPTSASIVIVMPSRRPQTTQTLKRTKSSRNQNKKRMKIKKNKCREASKGRQISQLLIITKNSKLKNKKYKKAIRILMPGHKNNSRPKDSLLVRKIKRKKYPNSSTKEIQTKNRKSHQSPKTQKKNNSMKMSSFQKSKLVIKLLTFSLSKKNKKKNKLKK